MFGIKLSNMRFKKIFNTKVEKKKKKTAKQFHSKSKVIDKNIITIADLILNWYNYKSSKKLNTNFFKKVSEDMAL